MAELKIKPDATPFPVHKDGRGQDCRCFIFRDHHKDTKGEECICKIGMDHNTKSLPHKDEDDRPCSGPFISAQDHPGKRTCHWCRREEVYSGTELTIVFKKGITAVTATEFLLNFKIGKETLTIARDKARGLVEKKDIVAITASIPPSSGKPIGEWILEIQKSDLVWFADRVMIAAFPKISFVSEATPKRAARRNQEDDDSDLPDATSV